MDRQARKLNSVREDGIYGEETFPEPGSDEEEKEVTEHTIVIGQSGDNNVLGCLGCVQVR